MARPGPAPRDGSGGDWVEVYDRPFLDGRSRECPVGDEAHALTVRWWETIREMPHAALWTPSDWLFAEDTATLKDRFYKGELSDTATTEMRRREDQMGTTVEARRKNRLRYVEPRAEAGASPAPAAATGTDNVTPIAGRRARLLED